MLGWANADEPVALLALIGLAFLLLLSGLEIDFARLRGPVLRLTGVGFGFSFALALVVGYGLRAEELVHSPLLIAIILSATALGVILPILKDAGETATPFGQVVVAAAAIAEIVPIVLLSLFFTGEAAGIGAKLVLLIAFFVFVAAVASVIFGLEHSKRISAALVSCRTPPRRSGCAALFCCSSSLRCWLPGSASRPSLAPTWPAPRLSSSIATDGHPHPVPAAKLQAVGFGVFVPFFFVSTGIQLDVKSLFRSGSTLGHVAIFLVAMLAVRGIPAVLYGSLAQRRGQLVGAGLIQATSLSLPVVAGKIGVTLGLIRRRITWH